MPEGPSLRRWHAMAAQFKGRQITHIAGSSKFVDKAKWIGAFLSDVAVQGKRLYLHLQQHGRPDDEGTDTSCSELPGEETDTWLKCHFLMWGSMRVNEFNCKPSKTNQFPEPRLIFYFSQSEFLVFYGGSFREDHRPPDANYADILSEEFNVSKAVDYLLEDRPACFTLMDQAMFPGVGNIIKNEVLFEAGVHPMQSGAQLSRDKAVKIVHHAITFSRRWLDWLLEEKHKINFGDMTSIYKKAKCPLDHRTTKSEFGPEGMERISYWCTTCQPEPQEALTQGHCGSMITKVSTDLQSKHCADIHSDQLSDISSNPDTSQVTSEDPPTAKRIKVEVDSDDDISHSPQDLLNVPRIDTKPSISVVYPNVTLEVLPDSGEAEGDFTSTPSVQHFGESSRISLTVSTIQTLMKKSARVTLSHLK